MADSSDQKPRTHKTFLELTEEEGGDNAEKPKSQATGRRLTKGERYEITRVERGIKRRVRRDGTGKPAYEVSVWVNGRAFSKTHRTQSEARRSRDEMVGKRASGTAWMPSDRRIKIARFVTQDWYVWLDEQVQFGKLRPSTVSWYRDGSRRLVDEIGDVRVAAVGKKELRGMLAQRIDAGDSQHTLRQLRASTSSVLALAVDSDILDRNPSEVMFGRHAPQALEQPEPAPKAWSQSEAQTFLEHARGDRLEALWILLLGSGLRRGEALALRWQDIDFGEGTVTVERSLIQVSGVPTMSVPKTEKSLRTISVASSAIAALGELKRSQASEKLVSREWEDKEGLLFTSAIGVRLRPDYATRKLKKLVNEAGLPWVRLHGMRHTAASQLHDNDVPMATISEWLGHADVGITIRTYIHGSAESGRAAADLLDAALFQ